ncbi:ABC transporter permease subunit [Clostridium thermobutyricum]|uniref:ABC transporter permease n=1 Tax=Clostridium thermobutyricum TaxID=29372 RepID=UPI002943837A|nr:ABC transporter permease subunit [Clostridium thermobutyricum]
MNMEKSMVNRKFGVIDVLIFLGIAVLLYIALTPAINGDIKPTDVGSSISTNISAIPFYMLKSVGRMAAAYVLSLIFTLIYGHIAAHNKKAERIMIPILDILQSIPVLSFLPAVLLGLMALFPKYNIGVELASIILIFTSQAWNMAFSFYNSIKLIPKDLDEASDVFRLNKWQKFRKLEVPFSMMGLVWNSMMSWAGGWFFLMTCEMFTMNGKTYALPGIGSYLQVAANEGNMKALFWGIISLIIVIILLDQLIWKPLNVWADKFKMELTQTEVPHSALLTLLRRSAVIGFLVEKIFKPIASIFGEKLDQAINKRNVKKKEKVNNKSGVVIKWIIRIVAIIIFLYAAINASKLIMKLSMDEILEIFPAVGATLLRVLAAQIIAIIWTVPVGVAIGLNKKLARILQPIVQIAASVPATALFPVLLLFLINKIGGLNIAAVILMLMGTQWYILFNVIAGAMAIPEDLKAAAKTFGITGIKKWKVLILPAIFPYLVTGMITAAGGCWNASIVAEYVTFGGKTVTTVGLGALISESTASGNFAMLLLSTLTMAIVVVAFNKIVWNRLYRLAEEKFKMEL